MAAHDFAVLRIEAREACVGDELLSGPQGPVDGNPTILALATPNGGCVAATLRDDIGREDVALWLPSTPLTVYRVGVRKARVCRHCGAAAGDGSWCSKAPGAVGLVSSHSYHDVAVPT